MTTYFDLDQDRRLINPQHRSYEDLDVVAQAAEEDVIATFRGTGTDLRFTVDDYRFNRDSIEWSTVYYDTVSTPAGIAFTGYAEEGGFYIALRGYKPDASQAEPNLAAAMKKTIADVINFRCAQVNVSPLEKTSSSDGRVVSYREDATDLFPRNWEQRLKKFDLRRTRLQTWSF